MKRIGRAWKILSPSVGNPNQTRVLLCIGSADPNGNLRIESDREWDFWREIQLEALRCGLEPRLVAWNDTPLPLDDRCHG
ncbi:MAG: hypothetical protein AAB214_16465, partial [Fibrobacterota bacterium]